MRKAAASAGSTMGGLPGGVGSSFAGADSVLLSMGPVVEFGPEEDGCGGARVRGASSAFSGAVVLTAWGPSERVAGGSSEPDPEPTFEGLEEGAGAGVSRRFLALKKMSGHRMVFKWSAQF